jgi:hypothetical protein
MDCVMDINCACLPDACSNAFAHSSTYISTNTSSNAFAHELKRGEKSCIIRILAWTSLESNALASHDLFLQL